MGTCSACVWTWPPITVAGPPLLFLIEVGVRYYLLFLHRLEPNFQSFICGIAQTHTSTCCLCADAGATDLGAIRLCTVTVIAACMPA